PSFIHTSTIFFLFFFYCFAAHQDLHSFPTRRSSDLMACRTFRTVLGSPRRRDRQAAMAGSAGRAARYRGSGRALERSWRRSRRSDRKSTRLNSSHDQISYAVFCLKKKKTKNNKKKKT